MATTHPSGSAADATASAAVDEVSRTLETVFSEVARTRDRCERLVAAAQAVGRRPTTEDFAALPPLLREQLAAHRGLISGAGFIAEPGLLADAPFWLQWWQTGADGSPRPLRVDLDPTTSAYSDYTHWEWFSLPRDTGQRAVSGPYVDYLCSDEYSLTLSLPVRAGGRFAGVAAADVYLRHFEAAVMPALQRLGAPAYLLNTRGRVVASTDARHLAGSLVKGLRPSAQGETGGARDGDGPRLRACGDMPLLLVTGQE